MAKNVKKKKRKIQENKEIKNREKFNIVIRSIGITREKWLRILNPRKICWISNATQKYPTEIVKYKTHVNSHRC